MFWFIIGLVGGLGCLIVWVFYIIVKGLAEGYKQTQEEGWEDPFR